jgi:glycosyltransferase involved in cell wall biosynthesis
VKILMVHNFYQQRAGESAVFEAERRMLLAANHTVVSYTRDSKEIDSYGSVIARESPDVAHFTNTFPLISPSAYYACRKEQVPVVQSIHNYRLVCPAATLWRNGAICEECVDHSLLRSVRYACYRQSRSATAVLAAMLSFHRSRGTYVDLVDRYIALTEFARDKLVAGGIPQERIAVKSNFAEPDPSPRNELGNYALFAGRLTDEKGTHVLLDAWKRLDSNVPLRVAGDGPQREQLERRVTDERIANVTFLGALPAEELMQELRSARVLVFPSRWYEGMPMSIVEAFACGVPTIASRLGGMREMIEDGRTGLLVAPADAADLAATVSWAFSHDAEIDALGRAARAEYEKHYTAAANCTRLIEIYRQAIEQRRVETP